jgi:hypothetical protein
MDKLDPFLGSYLTKDACVMTQQQLQESGLLHHLGAILTSGADALKAVTAAAFEAPVDSSDSGSSSTTLQQPAQSLQAACLLVWKLVGLYNKACRVLRPGSSGISGSPLPATPAAMRLILTTYQCFSNCLQPPAAVSSSLPGREGPVSVLAAFHVGCTRALSAAQFAMLGLAEAVHHHAVRSSLESLPGAHELLLCPELVSCLAIQALVMMLRLETGAAAATGSMGEGAAVVASSSSSTQCPSGSSSGVDAASSSSDRLAHPTEGSLQQPAAPAGSSAEHCTAGISSSSSNSAGLDNGVSLDSLNPLSLGLFGLLGVGQGVLLQAATAAGHIWRGGFMPASLPVLFNAYHEVLAYQVSKEQSAQRLPALLQARRIGCCKLCIQMLHSMYRIPSTFCQPAKCVLPPA